MTRSEELAALADEVEKADGPDDGLDERIRATVLAWWCDRAWAGGEEGRRIFGSLYDAVPAYTASVDAILALIGEVLPGWRVSELSEDTDGRWFVIVTTRQPPWQEEPARANNAALALTAALLRALAASTGDEHVV